MQQTVEKFLHDIKVVGKQLQTFSGEIENREEQIKRTLIDLHEYAERLSTIQSNNEFSKAIEESVNLLRERLNNWASLIETHIEGKDFINQFEKSVVIAVFGNVNAGKSSLGNLIAGNAPQLGEIYGELPPFYIYDLSDGDMEKGAQQLPKSEFKEGATETTASIQYFTLRDGLTWVDTPGIHSINQQNEMLAKKYVDFADLILFLVPSTAPGKADEIEELSRLIQKQKSLLIAITKSDKIMKDEVEGKLIRIEVAKEPQVRKKQEDYLEDELKQKGIYSMIKDASFTSLSVNIAKKALAEDDEILFESSGLPAFYDQIGKLLTSNAISLKQQRPIQQINATIVELVDGFKDVEGLTQMIEQLKALNQQFSVKKDDLKAQQQKITDELIAKCSSQLDTALFDLNTKFSAGHQVSEQEISQLIENIILKNYQNTVQKRLANIISDVHIEQRNALEVMVNASFETKYSEVSHEQYDVDTVKRDPKGLIENVGAFLVKRIPKQLCAHVQ